MRIIKGDKMNETIKVTILGKVYEVLKNTTLEEISKLVENEFQYSIILAKANNEYRELNQKINKDCEIEFYDLTNHYANRIYINGLILLMTHAYKKLTGKSLKVNHSLDKGLYIKPENEITEETVELLAKKMREIIEDNKSIDKLNVSRINAMEYFKNCHEYEKLGNMKYNTDTTVTLYKLEDSYDYFYSKMPSKTGMLKDFALTYLNKRGFVLRFPTVYHYQDIKAYEHRPNVYNLFKTSRKWAKTIGLEYVYDLNENVSKSKINDIIRMDEIKKNSELLDLATKIASRSCTKIVLLAGPSSSGKTTTCNKLALCLKSCGLSPIVISMDDYFVEREETPIGKDGEPNFECLEAIDLKLFNETMDKLMKKEKVTVPSYNFLTGSKEFKNTIQLKDNDILLIEGIHCLNPEILKDIPKEQKCRVYLSALTELNIDRHNRISTTDNRLLRRIVRDNRTRGYGVEQTLAQWKKVREGEENYIFPFQDAADYTINTSMIYEIGVLKIYVEPLLYSVDIASPYYADAKRLIRFLNVFLPIPPDEIPIDSVLREFIGGGCFKI